MTATTPETTVETLPYKNPDLPASERIADLLSRMTLEEKVGQMMQLDARGGDLDELIVNKHVGSILHTSPEDLPRAVETVNTKTRLGIPLVIGDDCIHGYSFWPGATIFPSQLGMALSWDPKAVEAAGRATAEEVSSTGVHWTFSPVLCIARDTRWGRVDETFGEDPMLIGEMASAMVKGYQGGAQAGETLPKDAILACAKHFAGYSETQGGRDASEADLSHRKLESWFLPPFERIAKEGCGCLCSISCCGFSHDDFSGLGRACRPRNGLNWMVLVSPPERTGKDYDQHAPSTVYPSFAAERGIRRVDRAENTCQRADGA